MPLAELLTGKALSKLRMGASKLLRHSGEAPSVRQSIAVSSPFSDLSLIRNGYSVRHMVSCGMVDLVSFAPHTVGVFFFRKKDGRLRIIFDTRIANVEFNDPPPVRLPTAECYSNLEIGGAVGLSFADGGCQRYFLSR